MFSRLRTIMLLCMVAFIMVLPCFAGDITTKYTDEEIAKGIVIKSPKVIQTTDNDYFQISVGMDKPYDVSMRLVRLEVTGSNMLKNDLAKEAASEEVKKTDDVKKSDDSKKTDDAKLKKDSKKDDPKITEKLILFVEDMNKSEGFGHFIKTVENVKPGDYKIIFIKKDTEEVVKEYKFTLRIKETITETDIKNVIKTGTIEVKTK